ncbi:MAG: type II toxin-antitoxin system ParD family antitoxin [Pirellulales bacterium]|nr:type II toxin-antitoxin system ParD family antitoxin [Pirellulales bacterium]
MVVSMPPELDAFIHQAVAAGMFESEEAVIVAGLRLLQEREHALEELREELRPALDALDRGEGKPLDFEEIKIRGRRRLAAEGR